MPSFLPELTRRVSAALAVAALVASTMPAAQAAGVPGQGTWETTLQGRDLDGNAANGFEAYYDTALNITWLADANFAKTSGYDSDGYMTWNAAKTWADNLVVGAYSDWRLPIMVDTGTPGCDAANSGTDCGWNVSTSTSEMAHMFYVTLGNKAYYNTSGNSQVGWGLTNAGPFKNVQSFVYWSGVEYAPGSADYAWGFDTLEGNQNYGYKDVEFSAWAVRPGDVAAVPEPQSYALALAGLAVAAVWGKRRQR